MAEAETGLAGLKWVVSAILCETLKQGYAYLDRDVPQEIEDLERKLIPRLKLVIQAAEKSPNEIRVKKWLEKLKFALYDLEDLLVEHEYGRLKHQINGNRCCECLPAHPLIETLQNLYDTLSRKVPENKRLLKQLKILKNTATEGSTFFKLLGKDAGTISELDGITSLNTRILMPDSEMFAREMEQQAIVSHILESNGNDPQSSTAKRFSVFGIVGDGGLGKTTLAHHIFDDERMQDYFNIRMWVNMSLKLDTLQHTKEMINCVSIEKCQQIGSLENLQKELGKILNKRDRILLVLDNVWWNQSDGDQWESMLDPFRHYANNVTVLLTSRSENLPHPLLPAQIVSLIGLEKDKLSSLFLNYALNNSEKIEPNKREALESISDGIILKFGGSPMTAKFVGDIKHLRYLNLANTTIIKLPDSICNLYNLQLLKLNSYIGTLPNYITHLVKLRYLEAYDSTNQITIQTPSIPHIGRLTLLKQLEEFHIRKVDGYNLGQLGNLNDLQGTLKLKNLENVETKEEAMEACLSNKKNIEELHLLWGNNDTKNLDLEAEVIESLRLPPNLKRLTIKKYKNIKFPSWVLDQLVIENLEYLYLSKCDAIEDIPDNIGLSASSFELFLEKLWNLKILPTLPTNTSYGDIFMNKVLLREWRIIEEICKDEEFDEYLSKSALDINDDEPPENNRHYALQEGLASISISHSSTLEKLVVYKCPDLYSLEGLLDRPMLKHVELMYLPKLVPGSFTDEGFGIVQLQSLEVLKVSGCDMSSLGPILKSLSSLQRLELFECWGISTLPEMPESLETIQIEQWPELTSRCQELYGEDWPKIAHVPERLIWNWAF
ncbi:hypothetical protein LUZ61_005877 [Rhynchospora tenuis]|uniref:NB-ARC domain-containing protein n=1 Tax=Rhynchospora tenuis TaxID=198213 RepID=A0AAD5ZQJ7_9POAL|nr:hypothetical protein LUZ61_005877 [Rhynchospora tenuis]